MRKQKKSKVFKYNLQTVLKVREIFEKQEQEKYVRAQKELEKEQEREKTLKDQKSTHENELASRLIGEMTNFTSVMSRHEHLKKIKIDVDKQVEVREETELKKEEQQKRLVQAVKDRKILEKDKDNKQKEWKKIMNREEIKFLSDIANTTFARRQMEEKSHQEFLKRKAEDEADSY